MYGDIQKLVYWEQHAVKDEASRERLCAAHFNQKFGPRLPWILTRQENEIQTIWL